MATAFRFTTAAGGFQGEVDVLGYLRPLLLFCSSFTCLYGAARLDEARLGDTQPMLSAVSRLLSCCESQSHSKRYRNSLEVLFAVWDEVVMR
jgi:hypothetical protein